MNSDDLRMMFMFTLVFKMDEFRMENITFQLSAVLIHQIGEMSWAIKI
jgi:hypothetical protein